MTDYNSYLRFIQGSHRALFILIVLFQLLGFQFPGHKIQTHFLGEGDFWFATTQDYSSKRYQHSSVSLNNDPACHLVKLENTKPKVVETQWHTPGGGSNKAVRSMGCGVSARRGTNEGIKGGPFVQFPTREKSKTRVCWTTAAAEPAESLKRVVNAVTVQQLPPSLVNSRHSSKHVVVKL